MLSEDQNLMVCSSSRAAMALKTIIQFPVFAPPYPPSPRHRPTTEIRFSRWNNANAEKFIRHERTQKEIEDQIRFEKRFDTALNIAHNYNPAPRHPTTFKSTGTPSQPSQPSIPAKFSKYSKKFTNNPKLSGLSHPAFRPVIRPRKIPKKEEDGCEDETEARNETTVTNTTANITIDENGVAYEMPYAPFAYQYSYTETPKMKPVKMREPLVSPFGPETMGRPWTGRKPLPPSKRKLPEFDSFRLPPPHKKGVKPVQAPGPFLQGTGPRYVKSREEILGEPLTKEEVEELIKSCRNTTRQLNIGRDGLTHNMLENIHAHWKRRRVCKIKCKGVCTVDMDNVRQQLEEKTGGKIIYCKGGVIYLFRGRNYNFKTRPRFPLMLWRPVSPVYPRLIKRVPEGLTLEEASEMRKKGRNLTPICKLAKNGVYGNLIKNVREAFEECELVRINCQGLNPSDFKKIGAKLKDLVPCVLISFENEHILMWRGHNWKSSLPGVKDDLDGAEDSTINIAASSLQTVKENAESASISSNPTVGVAISGDLHASSSPGDGEAAESEKSIDMHSVASPALALPRSSTRGDLSDGLDTSNNEQMVLPAGSLARMGHSSADEGQSNPQSIVPLSGDELLDNLDSSISTREPVNTSMQCTEGVLLLRKEAVESGSAIILDNSDLNADIVYQKAIALAKLAPPGPIFKRRPKQLKINSGDKQQDGDSEVNEATKVSGIEGGVSDKKGGERKSSKSKRLKDIKKDYSNVVPQGSLRVDELAKLLA